MTEINLKETEYISQRPTGVRNMLPDEQPREKLMKYGSDVLTDSELLAILLRSGTKGMNVMETSRHLLETNKGLHRLVRCDWQEISRIKGIGKVKAITLMAAFELARRLNQDTGGDKVTLHQPDQVYGYFGPMMRDLKKEIFIVAYLNSAKVLTGYDRISVGGTNATIVDPPEVLRKSVMNHAHGIILLHNHPSGNTTPSRSDISLTQRLVEGGRMMGIQVLDHIIVAGFKYTSMRDKGIIT
ncbi:MAG: DNA repair protein RadC [Balneolia bacterium]|nr:DNA repair protein RadC [Balneolia bacterium]